MSILERAIDLIAPHMCLVCQAEGSILCAWCRQEFIIDLPSRCYRCQKLSPESRVCQKCRRISPLGHVWVSTEYTGAAKQLLHALKFERASAAARPIALVTSESLPFLPDNAVLVHVAAATSRVRQRGYDQSKLIAVQLGKIIGRRRISMLARLGQSRQVGATRQQRLKQLEGAFRPLKPVLIEGAHIVLVDDVVTTGATLEEAARTLKNAGAKQVDAVVFAQKI